MSIKKTELLRASQSWDGVALPDYPSGRPELSVVRLVFPVGAKTTWHHHNVINYGIVEQGELTIVCADGAEKTFRAGEALVEVVGTIHRGENTDDLFILNYFLIVQVVAADNVVSVADLDYPVKHVRAVVTPVKRHVVFFQPAIGFFYQEDVAPLADKRLHARSARFVNQAPVTF